MSRIHKRMLISRKDCDKKLILLKNHEIHQTIIEKIQILSKICGKNAAVSLENSTYTHIFIIGIILNLK